MREESLGLQKLQGTAQCIVLEWGESNSHTGLELPAGPAGAPGRLRWGFGKSGRRRCRPLSLVWGKAATQWPTGALQPRGAWARIARLQLRQNLSLLLLAAPGRRRSQ